MIKKYKQNLDIFIVYDIRRLFFYNRYFICIFNNFSPTKYSLNRFRCNFQQLKVLKQQQINSLNNNQFQIKPFAKKLKKYKQYSYITRQKYLAKTLIIKQMHQISLEDLAQSIPKKVAFWSSIDICTWLSLNQIDIDHNQIKANKINGINIKKLTPMDWIQKYGLTKFIARQIVEWLEQDAPQFDTIVQQNQQDRQNNRCITQNYINQKQNKIINQLKSNQDQNLKLNESNKNVTVTQQDYVTIESNSINNKNTNQQKQLKKQKQKSKINSQKQITSSNNLSQPISKSLSDSGSSLSNNQDEDQIVSLKSQDKLSSSQNDKFQQLEIQRIHSQVTQRLQIKKIKNQVQVKSSNNIKQKDILENQNLNIGKWAIKKKQDSKTFNQRLKNKNKQISKNPKLYNYLQINIPQNENQSIASMGKRLLSPQELRHLNNRKIPQIIAQHQVKQKNNYQQNLYGLTPSSIIGNPYVKFVSSQFIPFISPQRTPKNFKLYEKILKITAPDYQKVITGFAKIGRLKQNEIPLTDETVSRNHAQIVPIVPINGHMKFGLKDIGSRFGTFVQCRGIQQNIQGKSFLIGDSQIQIISIQLNKQINLNNNLTNKKPTFDLKVKIDRQKQLNLLNRNLVTIGKKTNHDIRIQNNCGNAKIWMQKDKKIYLDGVQGKLYVKLKQHQIWDIESHVDINKQVQVVFGWFKVNIEVMQICKICGRKSSQCFCSARQEANKINIKS